MSPSVPDEASPQRQCVDCGEAYPYTPGVGRRCRPCHRARERFRYHQRLGHIPRLMTADEVVDHVRTHRPITWAYLTQETDT